MAEKARCEICDRTFKDADSLAQHNAVKHSELVPKEKEPFPVKKVRNLAVFVLIAGFIIWGIVSLTNNSITNKTVINESELNFEVPRGAIHWHPHLTIKIDGKPVPIPANIGITSNVHYPMHTHEKDGTIHMENNRPTKKNVVLGYFFEVWGEKFGKDCILEYCTDKGTLKMSVNGKENLDFENYFMQDKDQILIEYKTNSS